MSADSGRQTLILWVIVCICLALATFGGLALAGPGGRPVGPVTDPAEQVDVLAGMRAPLIEQLAETPSTELDLVQAIQERIDFLNVRISVACAQLDTPHPACLR